MNSASSRKLPCTTSHQARGQARIEVILNATASMVAESGVASVTMHLVSKRAKTSIGSMYHFFPDREHLLQSLVDRHVSAMRHITQRIIAIPAEVLQALSAAAVIDYLITPYVEYINQHPDFLALMHECANGEGDADSMRTFRHILDSRLPKLDVAIREDYVAVMHAIATGGMHAGYQASPQRASLYLREVPRVLAVYLAHIEQTLGATEHGESLALKASPKQ